MDSAGATAYVSAHFEQLRTSGGVTNTSYYYFGAQRVAMRVAPSGTLTGTLYWIHSDYLGSASLTTNVIDTKVSELRNKPHSNSLDSMIKSITIAINSAATRTILNGYT